MKPMVFVVEDSMDDYEAISESLAAVGVGFDRVVHFQDGSQLIAYLEQKKKPASDPSGPIPAMQRPTAILLDVNLPAMSGHAVLRRIRQDEAFGLVPVIMLSSSAEIPDVVRAYQNGANSYLRKPHSLDDFEVLMKRFKVFWLDTAMLPPAI